MAPQNGPELDDASEDHEEQPCDECELDYGLASHASP
jgi:hypothetical protein